MKTRVLLCDDHGVVLEGIKAALAKYDDVEVVGVCSDGREAVKKVETLKPDIVIMDIVMPHFNGIEATHQIKKLDPSVKVIIFTLHSYQDFLTHLVKAGISAYVLKQSPLSDLYLAIQVARRGGTFFSEDAPAFLAQYVRGLEGGQIEQDPLDKLSLREREVFQLLAEGYSVREAADSLCLSPKTVETHKYHIMHKLQLRSNTEMTKEAIRRGILQL